ncbi:MAG TPA: hypothetical protein VGQ36_12250 [Thermoanaerobaculia bacterium]|jgi:hypothetical protein|nr:hypothetical protein [Thermoanaerobaculia bacterium]
MPLTTLIGLLIALVVAVAIAVGLAWLPMRLLIGQMATDISNFIQRQRERRRVQRETPDRRQL